MNGKLRKRWITVGVIWSLVLILTGLNMHLVGRIKSQRRELEVMRLDLRFLNAHQNDIWQVRLDRSRLTHPVQSFGLGFLEVENDLKQLSCRFGLQETRVQAQNNSENLQAVPITVSTSGPVPAIMGWIAAVEEAYPYLAMANMDIARDPQKGTTRLQAIFNYRFILSEPESAG